MVDERNTSDNPASDMQREVTREHMRRSGRAVDVMHRLDGSVQIITEPQGAGRDEHAHPEPARREDKNR